MPDNAPHPRIIARGTRTRPADPQLHVIVHALHEERAQWIERELAHVDVVVQCARNIEHVVAALVEDPPPRPQVLIVDFDTITPVDLLHLHTVRDQGWCGRIIGIGVVPAALRASLLIERVFNTPLVQDMLREEIADLGFSAKTRRIPVLHDRGPAFIVRAQHVKIPRTITRR